jgi:DNA-directed RNA polymerase specialized sigma24 family protein
MMEESDTQAIVKELRHITKILIAFGTRGQKQREQIELLSNAGFEPKEISELLGTTPNTVRVTLSAIRRGAPK